jgi:DNA polymerase elongation subunit (family B)
MDILRLLSRAETAAELRALLPEAVLLLRERAALLRQGQVELEQLVVSQRLTRSTDEYLTLSPAAVTAQELELHGRSLSVGQRARFLYVRGWPRVAAWDSGDRIDPLTVDCDRYITLLIRAAASALEPLGVGESQLREWCSGAFLPGQPGLRLFSPQTFWR